MNRSRWDLFCLLTAVEFRARDQGTALGFLWTLLRPLTQFAILYTVFGGWMGPRVDGWAAYLLVGVVQWDLFAGVTGHSLTCLRRKSGLLRAAAFPRVLVVLSTAASVLLSHLAEWALLLAVLPLLGVPPRAAWLALPALIAAEAALALGAACLLAALAPALRDLEQAWGLALYALFFLTPVFYAAEMAGPQGQALIALNPLAALIEATRDLLWGRALPELTTPAALAAASAAAGLFLFPRLARGAEERL
ncbi:MAG: ABC transporter permease [Elusimicrobia bacterium]|nr:ABC transporter permease [Elusimicrobiota bacterium]